MLKIYNNLKKKIAIFLVIVISVTQNLTYLSPIFAEELAGSHPQEGSFGETHPYSMDDVTVDSETTVGADSEDTVDEDIYNNAGADIIRQEEEETEVEENSQALTEEEEPEEDLKTEHVEENIETEQETETSIDKEVETLEVIESETILAFDNETTIGVDTIHIEEEYDAGSHPQEGSFGETHFYESESEIENEADTQVQSYDSKSEIEESIVSQAYSYASQSEIEVEAGSHPQEGYFGETHPYERQSYATESEINDLNEIEVIVASESEINDLSITQIYIATESEIYIATNSEIIIASDSELTIATISEINYLNLSFEEELEYNKIKFKKDENKYTLNDNATLLKTIYINEELVFDMNSYKITAPDDGEAFVINKYVEFITSDDTKADTSMIEGKNNEYPVIKVNNSKLNIGKLTINAAHGGDAVHLINSDMEVNGAIITGGDGESKTNEKGEDGGNAIVINWNTDNNKFVFNTGIISGGNGGDGVGSMIANAGSAYKYGKRTKITDKLMIGNGGEIGGGDGGNGIYLKEGIKYKNNVYINNFGVYAGNGGKKKDSLSLKNKSLILGANLPASYDLRKLSGKNYVTSIKDQKWTDWCLRFSSIAAAETDLIKNNKAYLEELGYDVDSTLKGLYNDNEVDFSERHLATYDQRHKDDPLGNAGASGSSNGSGNVTRAGSTMLSELNFLSTWRAIAKEKDYPFLSNDISAMDQNIETGAITETLYAHMKSAEFGNFGHSVAEDEATYKAAQNEYIAKLKQAIQSSNGAAFGVMVYQSGGYIKDDVIYKGEEYSTFNLSYDRVKRGTAGMGGHGMFAIGWDDNFPKENFGNHEENITKNGAILCKNSWGEYTWIPYEYAFDGSSFATMEFVPANTNYENLYFYDGGTTPEQISFEGTDGNKLRFFNIQANSFTIQNDQEKLRAIVYSSVYDYTPNIFIYKSDVDNADAIQNLYKTDGKDAVWKKMSYPIKAGVNFIQLDKELDVKKDEVYFVVFDFNTKARPTIPIDLSNQDDGLRYNTTYANKSYLHSEIYLNTDDGRAYLESTDWYRMDEWGAIYGDADFENANLRIKIVTNNFIKLDAKDGHFGSNKNKKVDYLYRLPNAKYNVTTKPISNEPAKYVFSHYDFDGVYVEGDPIDVDSNTIYEMDPHNPKTLYAIYKVKPAPGPSPGGGGSGGGGGGGASLPFDNIVKEYVNLPTDKIIMFAPITAMSYENKIWKKDAISGKWNYEFTLDGTNYNKAVGWVKENNFNPLTNAVEESKYYFDENGDMVAGFVTDILGNTYYLDETPGPNLGKMVKGEREIGGSTYFFLEDGTMLRNFLLGSHQIGADGKFLT